MRGQCVRRHGRDSARLNGRCVESSSSASRSSSAILVIAAAAAYWFFSGDGIRLALERQASEWLGQPVRIASATGQVFPRLGIQLRDVRVGEPVQMTLADVEVSTSLRAMISRRIEDADIIIADSRIGLPLPIGTSEPTESEAGSDAVAAAAGPPVELVSVRTIALRDVAVVSRGREIVVSADAALAGSQLQITRFVASSGKTRLEASGTATLGPSIDAKFDVSANQLDLDELFALASAFLPAETAGAEQIQSSLVCTCHCAYERRSCDRCVGRSPPAVSRHDDRRRTDHAQAADLRIVRRNLRRRVGGDPWRLPRHAP